MKGKTATNEAKTNYNIEGRTGGGGGGGGCLAGFVK